MAMRALEGQDLDPVDYAETEIALARALWKVGRDKGRSLDLGRAARQHFVEAGDKGEEWAKEAAAWVKRHGG